MKTRNEYTAEILKVGRKTSGKHALAVLRIREHMRIPKFEAPNLEISKV